MGGGGNVRKVKVVVDVYAEPKYSHRNTCHVCGRPVSAVDVMLTDVLRTYAAWPLHATCRSLLGRSIGRKTIGRHRLANIVHGGR